MISAYKVSKSFGSREVFSELSFSVNAGERVGLVGPNGAGKSTMIKMLAGFESPDDGSVSKNQGLVIGCLPQNPILDPKLTVSEYLFQDLPSESSLQKVISQMGLYNGGQCQEDSLLGALSGGWQKRVALAREIAKDPDLLILDEPTNHLDIETILWLERFLENAAFSLLIVTHDRLFLQNTCNRIVEINRKLPLGILSIEGTYHEYLLHKQAAMDSQASTRDKLANQWRKEAEWLSRSPQARHTKQVARQNRAEDLSEKLGDVSSRTQNTKLNFQFQESDNRAKDLIVAKGIGVEVGSRMLFESVDVHIRRKHRYGLIGVNGSGKTTLIRALLREIPIAKGTLQNYEEIRVAYFDQHKKIADESLTLMKFLCPDGEMVQYGERFISVRAYLGKFLFSPNQMESAVSKLSGGERSRLLLANLMLQPSDVLILDEPTNDLDIDALQALETELGEFPGAVFIVSHDRAFLDHVCTEILALESSPWAPTQIHKFADVNQWAQWHKDNFSGKKKKADKKNPELSSANLPEKPNKKEKLNFNESRELSLMQREIEKKEAQIEQIQSRLAQSGASKELVSLTRELGELQQEVERLFKRWAELEARK